MHGNLNIIALGVSLSFFALSVIYVVNDGVLSEKIYFPIALASFMFSLAEIFSLYGEYLERKQDARNRLVENLRNILEKYIVEMQSIECEYKNGNVDEANKIINFAAEKIKGNQGVSFKKASTIRGICNFLHACSVIILIVLFAVSAHWGLENSKFTYFLTLVSMAILFFGFVLNSYFYKIEQEFLNEIRMFYENEKLQFENLTMKCKSKCKVKYKI